MTNKSYVNGRTVNLIQKRNTASAFATVSAVGLSGCDPVLNIAGAHFPAWLVCALAGSLLAALLWLFFLAVRIDAYLWPRPLVYSSLALLLAGFLYLIFFNHI